MPWEPKKVPERGGHGDRDGFPEAVTLELGPVG